MKSVLSLSLVGTFAVLGLAAAAQATPSITLLGDTGTWRVTSYDSLNGITGTGSNVLVNPYGAPPVPAVTPLAGGNGWSVVFTPTADFMAYASNGGGPYGQSAQMDGKLDFYITLDAPAKLTTNIYENGVDSTSGNGTFSLTGGAVVSGLNLSLVAVETHSNSFPAATPNGTGGWNLYDQVDTFGSTYSTYKISIDNTLLVSALSSQTPGSAYLAKKDFTLIFTTDGSSGGGQTPEPASLGVLATGCLALLVRRRRA